MKKLNRAFGERERKRENAATISCDRAERFGTNVSQACVRAIRMFDSYLTHLSLGQTNITHIIQISALIFVTVRKAVLHENKFA